MLKGDHMIITEILGNRSELSDADLSGLTEERVALDNLELVKRIQRVSTDTGREIGLRLDSDVKELKDGDILYKDDEVIITVQVKPTDVLIFKPTSTYEMGKVAHSLGNRHLQAQFFDENSEYGENVMVLQYDHTVEDHLKHHGVNYTREDRVMPEAFRHAEHSH